MGVTEIVTAVVSLIGGIGGWEAVKYFLNRGANKRMAETEADSLEFSLLRDTAEFLQGQLLDKEKRFAEQTTLLRKVQSELLDVTKEKSRVELELQTYRCKREHCKNRIPQNGF